MTTKNQKDYARKIARKVVDRQGEGFLKGILSASSFAEKVEMVRSVNPYFYLLTPPPSPRELINESEV